MVSEKQIEANRENAQLSTGPKNTDITRFNAITHGLCSKEIIVPGLENKEEFEQIGFIIRQQLDPKNPIEEILVERIVISYWRLRRAARVERGYISRINIPKKPVIPGLYDHIGLDSPSRNYTGKEKKLIEEIDKACEEVARFCQSMAPESELDTLLRYETVVERQFYRALRTLQEYRQKIE